MYLILPSVDLEQAGDRGSEIARLEDLALDADVCQKLRDLGITEPLEIQQSAVPKILSGLNCMVTAETGCGKTMAYLIPMVHQILKWKPLIERKHNTPLGLIVTPTRELAVQIGIEAKKLCNSFGISTKIFTGGKTKRMLRSAPLDHVDIVITSFGVFSKLTSTRVYNAKLVRHLVLDEADALFHETFQDKLRVFLKRIPLGNAQETDESGLPLFSQFTLVSATVPSRMEQIFGNIVNLEQINHITTGNVHRILVPQKFIRLGPSQKPEALLSYIKPKIRGARKSVIVFSNSNSTADWVKMFLEECQIPVVNLTGSMPLRARVGQYGKFLNGNGMVLSTTNAASRGLDTTMVNYVLNYEFPYDLADYIHRCGRTGRCGTRGECLVTSFISTPTEIRLVQKLELARRKRKPVPMFNAFEDRSKLETEKEYMYGEDSYMGETIDRLEDPGDLPY